MAALTADCVFENTMPPPDGGTPEGSDENAMGDDLGLGEPGRQRLRAGQAFECGGGIARRREAGPHGREAKIRLPSTEQLHIDFGQDLRVEQRAVLGAA